MANYLDLFRRIPAFEGGLSANPNDHAARVPGNAGVQYHTNKGVQWATFKDLAPRAGYPASYQLFLQMPDEVLKAIFKVGFWNPMLADDIRSQAVANQLVDFAWGSGFDDAVPTLQRLLNREYRANLVVDGQMGPRTLAALNSVAEASLVPALANARAAFLQGLNQPYWEQGWLNRVYELVPAQFIAQLGNWTRKISDWAKKPQPQQ